MEKFKNQKSILIFLFFSSFAALSAAYISQYFFNLQPCLLCLYQRVPFFLVIILSFFSFFLLNRKWQNFAIKIAILILFINVALAFYHVGVEHKIFLFEKCSDMSTNITDINQLKEYLTNTKAVRCDQPQFVLFKISMAGWNLIYCLFIIFITTLSLAKIK